MLKPVKPRSANIILQKRDIKLLEFLAKFGVVNERHAMHLLHVSENVLKNLLGRLIANTYICKQRLIANECAFLMLDKCGSEICSTLPVKNLNLNTLKHDMLVVDIYFALLAENSAYCINSERELKIACGIKVGDKKKVPDLLVDETIAIEVELTEKSNVRLVEIVSNYINDNKLHEIRYFVKSKTLGTKLLHLAGLHKKFKVFVIDITNNLLQYTELKINSSAIDFVPKLRSSTYFDLDAYLSKDWNK